ncbi:glycosyltransferase family 4 protein [Sinomicrobium soli]|uniref:glycosyltransferase family 4 protein n=1 Tax=Sinomicrobium sp. N-1-3-6 TaxID=2219864 RepID=UPI000DCE1C05|nr:glycosyltransferase family 4 protein [Sinomicrobium sp. N-1-3-6]RAV30990.1 hypothetical protein DN748_01725 [Sinomicrobium sp. N-1-3-6]
MKIVIISHNYPSIYRPHYGAFVYNFAQELSKYHEVKIIAPLRINDLFKKKKDTYGPENCTVYRPLYFPGFSAKIFGFDVGKILSESRHQSIERCFKKNVKEVNLIYSHFLINGISIYKLAKEKNIPMIIASGESGDAYKAIEKQRKDILHGMLSYVKNIICVSEVNYEYLRGLGYSSSKIEIIPNAVDYQRFVPMNNKECKEKLKISEGMFVVGFIGHFIERKGPNRVIKAIQSLNSEDIALICIGGNGKLIEASFVKEMAPMGNIKLPSIINSFDVFVLPTLSEGHCNVIEEVKACGVPIISSLGTTVENQIDNKTGILVDPLNIEAIANAIRELKSDIVKRQKFRKNLLELRGSNSLEKRVERINILIENSVNEESDNKKERTRKTI